MQRQASLHQLIMSLQMEQITSLKEWMTNTEDRISRLDAIGTQSSESAKQQLQEATEFQVLHFFPEQNNNFIRIQQLTKNYTVSVLLLIYLILLLDES